MKKSSGSDGEEQCVALVDYDALMPDEISFRKGDVICVTMKGASSGFWGGYVVSSPRSSHNDTDNNGNSNSNSSNGGGAGGHRERAEAVVGMFPNCMVSSNLRAHAPHLTSFANRALCLYDYTPDGSSGGGGGGGEGDARTMTLRRGDVITVIQPSYSPGWWLGIMGDGDSDDTTDNSSRSSGGGGGHHHQHRAGEGRQGNGGGSPARRVQLFPTSYVTCDIVRAVFRFDARQPHEMSCAVGDIICVHRRWNDGWWEGSIIARPAEAEGAAGPRQQRRGIFPSNYTAPNVPTTHPPFFCNDCKTVYEDDLISQTYGVHAAAPGPRRSPSAQQQQQQDQQQQQQQRACRRCEVKGRVLSLMVRALEEYGAGATDTLDLFRYVSEEEEETGLYGGVEAAAELCNSRRRRPPAFSPSTTQN